jgi:hypothetical protein
VNRGPQLYLRIDTRVGRFVLRQRIRAGPRPGLTRCARWPATALRLPRPWRRPCSTRRPDGSWILMDYVEGGMWTPPRLQAPSECCPTPESIVGSSWRLRRLIFNPLPLRLSVCPDHSIACGIRFAWFADSVAARQGDCHSSDEAADVWSQACPGPPRSSCQSLLGGGRALAAGRISTPQIGPGRHDDACP